MKRLCLLLILLLSFKAGVVTDPPLLRVYYFPEDFEKVDAVCPFKLQFLREGRVLLETDCEYPPLYENEGRVVWDSILLPSEFRWDRVKVFLRTEEGESFLGEFGRDKVERAIEEVPEMRVGCEPSDFRETALAILRSHRMRVKLRYRGGGCEGSFFSTLEALRKRGLLWKPSLLPLEEKLLISALLQPYEDVEYRKGRRFLLKISSPGFHVIAVNCDGVRFWTVTNRWYELDGKGCEVGNVELSGYFLADVVEKKGGKTYELRRGERVPEGKGEKGEPAETYAGGGENNGGNSGRNGKSDR